MSTQFVSETDLEELLQEEVPCMSCGKPAMLRSIGHGTCTDSKGNPPPMYKCLSFYQAWLLGVLQTIAAYDHTLCVRCGRKFPTVESFSDYRPF